MLNIKNARPVVTRLVKEAGEKTKQYLREGFSSHSKGGSDFATEADDAVDAFLRKELAKAFPQTKFLTEETAPDDYSSFEDTDDLWVIDPIDGTTNFSRGLEVFSISIALVSKGKPRLGITYAPLQDALYAASEDEPGTTYNDTPAFVSKTKQLHEALVCFDWSWDIHKRLKTYEAVGKIIKQVRAAESWGSAVVALNAVASGKVDGYFAYGFKPWDVAAGALLLERSGGMVTNITGGEWNIFTSDFLFSNGHLHQTLLDCIR